MLKSFAALASTWTLLNMVSRSCDCTLVHRRLTIDESDSAILRR
jgi:hypothetical protein